MMYHNKIMIENLFLKVYVFSIILLNDLNRE